MLRRDPLEAAPRAGFVANGILHLVVAWLALQVALGRSERADQAGALQAVASGTAGRVLVWAAVCGFAAVAVWRAYEAAVGHRRAENRLRKRLFAAGQVVLYGVLTALAFRVAAAEPAESVGPGVTARLLALPYGQAVVLTVGAGVVVVGGVMVVRGKQKAFATDMDLYRAGPRLRRFVERLGQVGAMTKGVAVGIVGVLVIVAAATYDPTRAQGLDVALKTLAAQPFGSAALVAVALGIACYGVFAFFDTAYHRV